MKDNKLIAEFMGYKLAKCNNGLAWESPYKKSVEDTFELHGRLWRENDSYYKFHTSWDWLMPVITNCKNVDADWINENAQHLIDNIDDAITCCYGIEDTHKAVVEFINEYNLNN